MPVEIDEIIGGGVPVIEDCAHGFGIAVGGKWLGSRARVGVLSFYATKLIGAGEGGAILTDSREIADYVRSARDYGDQPAAAHRMNDKMNDLEASLVLIQLNRLSELISARETIARRYINMLSSPSVGRRYRLPTDSKERVWYRFVVEMLTGSAETLVEGLQCSGIQVSIPVTDWRPAGSLHSPVADRAYRQLVSLPLYPTLTPNEQDCVVKSFLKVCEDSACA
jgi:perosamine synthetase